MRDCRAKRPLYQEARGEYAPVMKLATLILPLVVASLTPIGCKTQADTDVSRGAASAAPTAATAAPAGSGGVTITLGPGGKTTVQGGGQMKGDAKVCAAFRACCSEPQLGLFCGLLEASENDCGKARDQAKAHLKERSLKAPAGCE